MISRSLRARGWWPSRGRWWDEIRRLLCRARTPTDDPGGASSDVDRCARVLPVSPCPEITRGWKSSSGPSARRRRSMDS